MAGTGMSTLSEMTQRHFIESNRIEGVTDLGEVPKSIIAWNYLVSQPYLHTEAILTVHKHLMTGLMPRDVGEWRRCGVVVGGRLCPSYHDVPGLMSDFISYFDVYGPEHLDPRTMHIKFERIHPFRDGNGRTGRMLMWWHEVQKGQSPTLITYDERQKYYDWF